MKRVHYLLVLITLLINQSCNKASGPEIIDPVTNFASKPTSTYTSGVMDEYLDLQFKLIANTPGYNAPIAARSMAYISLAGYEAAVYGMEGNTSLAGKLQGLTELPVPDLTKEYHWGLAVSAAEYTLMKELYATSGDVLKSRMDTLRRNYETKFKPGLGTDATERSIKFGTEIGLAIWNYAKKDGGDESWNNNYPKSNSTFSGVGKWEPTGSQRRPLLPQWAELRTFLAANSNISGGDNPTFSFKNNTDFFVEAKKVYLTASNISEAQRSIMNFWVDPTGTYTTAGHHMANVRAIVNKEQYSLEKACILYLKTALALNDAYITSWKHKFSNNIMRPQTYIQQAIDPSWLSNIEASPTPDYTSEEASAAAVVALILKNEFGNEYTFEDTSKSADSGKRAYKGFDTYLTEASKAHLYAGTHFPISIENGILHGETIATNYIQLDIQVAPSDSSSTSSFSF